MKTKINMERMLKSRAEGLIMLAAATLLAMNVQEGKGQFSTNPPFFNYGFTNPLSIQKIGIGAFPTNPGVQAKLHVNQFLLAPNAATDGFLFRTDGNNSQNTKWQLFSGTSATAQIEKFNLNNPANTDDISLNVVQNGNLIFSTHNQPRMRIDSNGVLSIERMKCRKCFVITNEKGELLTMEPEEVFGQLKEQQALLEKQQKQIEKLQNEITALKQEKNICNKN
jgi:hypothetical protein